MLESKNMTVTPDYNNWQTVSRFYGLLYYIAVQEGLIVDDPFDLDHGMNLAISMIPYIANRIYLHRQLQPPCNRTTALVSLVPKETDPLISDVILNTLRSLFITPIKEVGWEFQGDTLTLVLTDVENNQLIETHVDWYKVASRIHERALFPFPTDLSTTADILWSVRIENDENRFSYGVNKKYEQHEIKAFFGTYLNEGLIREITVGDNIYFLVNTTGGWRLATMNDRIVCTTAMSLTVARPKGATPYALIELNNECGFETLFSYEWGVEGIQGSLDHMAENYPTEYEALPEFTPFIYVSNGDVIVP